MLNCMVTCRDADKKPHDNNLENSPKLGNISPWKGVTSVVNKSIFGNTALKDNCESKPGYLEALENRSYIMGKSFAPLSGNRYRSLG